MNGFREGDAVRAKIVKIDMEKGKINFGIKPKYFDDNEDEDEDDEDDEEDDDEEENGLELKSDDEDEEAIDREISSIQDLKEGQQVRGLVKNVQNGLFVALGRSVVARIKIRELFDEVSLSLSLVDMSIG